MLERFEKQTCIGITEAVADINVGPIKHHCRHHIEPQSIIQDQTMCIVGETQQGFSFFKLFGFQYQLACMQTSDNLADRRVGVQFEGRRDCIWYIYTASHAGLGTMAWAFGPHADQMSIYTASQGWGQWHWHLGRTRTTCPCHCQPCPCMIEQMWRDMFNGICVYG